MGVCFECRDGLLIHTQDVDLLRRSGLDSFDALMAVRGDRRLSKAGLPAWRERLELELEGATFYLKRYHRPPWSEQLRRARSGARCTAAIEWRWLERLADLGIAAPRPVAFGCRSRGGVELASLVVTAAVAGQSLETWASAGRVGPLADRSHRAQISRVLGQLVAQLHEEGLVHRDLYLSHVFMARADDDVRLGLIDLQRVLRPRLRRRRWVIKDLAALHYSTPPTVASRADRLRWYLRDYRGRSRSTLADRRLIRAVAAKSRRMARHSEKHGL